MNTKEPNIKFEARLGWNVLTGPKKGHPGEDVKTLPLVQCILYILARFQKCHKTSEVSVAIVN